MLSTLRQIPVGWFAAVGGIIVAIPFVVGVALGLESMATDLEVPAYLSWWLLLVVALVSRARDEQSVEGGWRKLLSTAVLVSVPASAVTLVGVFALFLSDPITSDDIAAALAVGGFFAGLLLAVAAATWGVAVVLARRARRGR